MATPTQTPSYCVVQWEDNKHDYAVVHIKRAKTSVPLKVGLTTSFEGNNRDRRRGKILYIGNKNDCTVFSFDFEGEGGHVNTYTWSLELGLSKQIEETAKAIKHVADGSLRRTISSSSTNSTAMSKNKKRKVNHKEQQPTDNPGVIDVNMMPASPPAPVSVLLGVTFSTITIGDTDQQSNSNNQHLFNSTNIHKDSTTNTTTTASQDINSLREENKALRSKIFELEEQLIFERQTSIRLPNEDGYNFCRNICLTYEQCRSEQHQRLVELGKKLPCSDVEKQLAKKPNIASTINNLIKYCFKGVDLTQMCYEKFKEKDPLLLKDIYEYVKCLHAPANITRQMFSNTISLKCRHVRDDLKRNKNGSVLKVTKHKGNQSNNRKERTKQNYETIHQTELEQSDDDKENDDHF